MGVSVTALHVPYKKDFEPMVIEEENVAIARNLDERERKFYRVKYIEPFFIKYVTPTIPNGESVSVKLDDLKLHDNEVAQIRLKIETDGFEVEVKLPDAISKYTTKNTVTRLSKWVTDEYPNLAEMAYMGNNVPKFIIYNNSGADGTCEIKIVGFRYVLEKLPHKPDKYTVLFVETIPSSS